MQESRRNASGREADGPGDQRVATRSLIYSNIHVYRLAMNVLYGGGYRARYRQLAGFVGPGVGSICDLCFGDTLLAEYSQQHGIEWVGVDINPEFCRLARGRGLPVIEGDVLAVDLPRSDLFVMAGSLYHFHDRLTPLFDAIFARTDRLLLSEPVRNLSSARGPIGWLSRRAADPGSGPASFRFDEATLLAALEIQAQRRSLDQRVLARGRDMIVELVAGKGDGEPSGRHTQEDPRR